MADADIKTEEKEEDRASEMEDEVPICCFAFDLICCPQKYWNISKRAGEDDYADPPENEGDEEKKEEKK